MTNKQKIFIVKLVHTIIYVVMVFAIFYILYAGITNTFNSLVFISLALVIGESVVFFANGKKCPLTDLVQKFGDEKGYVGDIFLPKSIADNTFYFFGGLFMLGIVLLLLNYFSII